MSEPGLSADVLLNIQSALSQVGDIEAALNAAVDGLVVQVDASGVGTTIEDAVAGAEAVVAVSADTSDAEASLTGIEDEASSIDGTIKIDADTSGADQAIGGVVSEAEATDATITVDADTGPAEDAISNLGESASEGGSKIEALGSHLEGLSTAGESAAGAAGAVAGGLAKISPQAAGAIAGIGALIGVGKSFIDQSLDAEVSLRRFDQTTGRFAADVRNINVGSLNGDLGDLALKLGTSDEAMQDAASRVFALGEANGTAGEKVAETADQILALGLRARATNPALGEAGTIAETLTSALARGGRALVPYGIALSAAEINARALADTGKSTATELTVYEKAAAGAAIATEKFGGSLAASIEAGTDNPAIRLAVLRNNFQELQERLGAKIQAPVLETLTALEPVAEALATALADVLEAVAPLAHLLAVTLGPQITLLGKGISLALKPLDLLASGVDKVVGLFHRESGAAKFANEVQQASAALQDEGGHIFLATQNLAGYIEQASRFKDQHQDDDLKRIGLSFEDVASLALKGKDGLAQFTAEAERAGEGSNVGDLVHSFTELQKVIDQVAVEQLTAAKNSGAITDAQAKAALAADDHVAALQRLQGQIISHNNAVNEATRIYGPLIQQQQAASQGLEALEVDSSAAHDAVLTLANSGVKPTDSALLSFATTMKDANLSTAAMDEAAAALGVTTDQLSGFIDGATSALNDFVKKAVEGLPSIDDAFSGSKSIEGFINNLNTGRDKTQQFMADLQTIFDAGGHAISGVLATQGVEAGGAYARTLASEIQKGDLTLVSNAEQAVDLHNREIQKATAFLTSTFGPEYIATTGQIGALASQAFDSNLDFATRTRLAAGLAASDLSTEGQAIAVIAANKGKEAADAYAALFKIDDATRLEGERAAEVLLGSPLPDAGRHVGQATSDAVGEGLLGSIRARVKAGTDAAGAAVSGAKGDLESHGHEAGTAAGKGTGTGFKTAAQSGIAGSRNAIGQTLNQTFDQIHEAHDVGVAIGETFSYGIAAGIKDRNSSAVVAAAARSVVKTAERAARAEAQSQSPSKLFAKVGADMSTGMAEGVEEVAPDVAKAAQVAVHNAFLDASAAAKSVQTLALDPIQQGMLGFARSLDRANLSADQFEQVARAVGVSVDDLKSFIDESTKAVDDFANSVISKFPQVADAFQGAANVTDFIANLRKSNVDTEKFMHNVQVIFAAGGKDVAATLAQQGAAAGGAYAQELADQIAKGDRTLVNSAEATVDEHNRILRDLTAEVQNDFAPAFIESTGKILDIAKQTGISGTEAGKAFADGLALGISQHTKNVESAAAKIVADAEAAARKKAKSKSPSLLFAELGRDLAAGVAEGLSDDTRRVIAEAEAIVQAAFDTMARQITENAGSLPDLGPQIGQAVTAALGPATALLSAVQADPTTATSVVNTGGQVSIGQITLDASGMTFPDVTTAAQGDAVGSALVSSAIEQLRNSQELRIALKFQGGI